MAQEQQREELLIRDRVTGQPRPYYVDANNINLGDDETYKSLPDVLGEMQDDIDDAKEHGVGSVTGVKIGDTTYDPDQQGVVDISPAIPDVSGKANKSEMSVVPGTGENADKTTITLKEGTSATVLTQHQDISMKANSSEVVKGIKDSNGNPLPKNQDGTITLPAVQAGDKVSVIQPDPADGTFTIRVGSDDFTVNLNHTHPNMAKLIVCEESDLPSTLDPATIYGVNDGGEIGVLYVGGIPFYGGGGGGISTPVLRRPADGSTITMIASGGGSVSETINIKGKNLTQSLIVEFANGSTGYSFDTTDLPTGVAYDSGTGKLTITKDAANAINGVDIVVVYTGSTYGAQGTLGISSSSVDGISYEVHLVAYSFENALAYWRGEDSVSNGKWIDHNNSLPIVLNGTAAKTGDGYQFDNLSSQLAAYALFDKTYNSTLNAQIDKVFTCIVSCKVKFGVADRQARIIDFGAFGNSCSGLSVSCTLLTDGTLKSSGKISSSAISGYIGTDTNTGLTFPLNTYVDVVVKLGSRILENGKQEVYCECGTGKCYGIIDTPVKWNFNGVDANAAHPNPAAFVLGLGYTEAQYVEQLAPKAYADVIYQSIVIFNSEI